MAEDATTDPRAPSEYAARLPIGERMPVDELLDDPLFPFEGELRVLPLEPPLVPEPERYGVAAADCRLCRGEGEQAIWEDDRWRLLSRAEPHGLPMVAVLIPRTHHDLEDLPADFAAELGPMMQRVARAMGRLDSVGRVHVNRWGDGSFHFHVWFLARPRGMWQMRGAMLAIWDDLLPRVPVDEWHANRRAVAGALAEEGGRSLLG
jgi:diadenosine tetraphosphate (Ap4A) HIT family hydrolase